MVAERAQKNLCFAFEPSKGFGVDYAIAIALLGRPDAAFALRFQSSAGVGAERSFRTKPLALIFLVLFAN
jgi:hypothetical protein